MNAPTPYIAIWVSFFVSLLRAQFNFADIGAPQCANSCVISSSSGPCTFQNQEQFVACICGQKAIIQSVTDCVIQQCSQSDQQKTLEIAEALCKDVGAPFETPTGVSNPGPVSAPTAGSATPQMPTQAGSVPPVVATAGSPTVAATSSPDPTPSTIASSVSPVPSAMPTGSATPEGPSSAGTGPSSSAARPTATIGVSAPVSSSSSAATPPTSGAILVKANNVLTFLGLLAIGVYSFIL